MESSRVSLSSRLAYDCATELYAVNQELAALSQKKSVIKNSAVLFGTYQSLSMICQEEEIWGKDVVWLDKPKQEATALTLVTSNGSITAEIARARVSVADQLSLLSEMFLEREIELSTPRVSYLPKRITSTHQRDFGLQTNPVEGKVIAVSTDGWVPAANNAQWHGHDLPAVTVEHRLPRHVRSVLSVLPLVVLDVHDRLQPNFVTK